MRVHQVEQIHRPVNVPALTLNHHRSPQLGDEDFPPQVQFTHLRSALRLAVSAPAALGIPLDLLLYLIRPVLASGKTIAADAVEYSPPYERDNTGARSAARLLWQIWQDWR